MPHYGRVFIHPKLCVIQHYFVNLRLNKHLFLRDAQI